MATYYASGRQGEMVGLKWPHVDLDERLTIFVEDLERRRGGATNFDDTKTETSEETVLIPHRLATCQLQSRLSNLS